MNAHQQEESNISLGNAKEADKQHSSNPAELREDLAIENTPFIARRYDELWMITAGRYKIEGGMKSYEECVERTKKIQWSDITTVIGAIAESIAKEEVNNYIASIREQPAD